MERASGWNARSRIVSGWRRAWAGRFTIYRTTMFWAGRERLSSAAVTTQAEGGGVVAWHMDRLHRDPRELEDFITLIEAAGAVVRTVTAGDIDLSDSTGRAVARILGAVARKESDDKSARIRRKHLELATKGAISGGGTRPYGYTQDRREVVAEEAAHIREAARRVLAGDSLRSVCG
jgi:DNA invertase Pin-like site-specific DNA recombinase